MAEKGMVKDGTASSLMMMMMVMMMMLPRFWPCWAIMGLGLVAAVIAIPLLWFRDPKVRLMALMAEDL